MIIKVTTCIKAFRVTQSLFALTKKNQKEESIRSEQINPQQGFPDITLHQTRKKTFMIQQQQQDWPKHY
jgi:hypothetical protein